MFFNSIFKMLFNYIETTSKLWIIFHHHMLFKATSRDDGECSDNLDDNHRRQFYLSFASCTFWHGAVDVAYNNNKNPIEN